MSGPVLVPFDCDHCKKTVYATGSATVGHVCKAKKPRPAFTLYRKRET